MKILNRTRRPFGALTTGALVASTLTALTSIAAPAQAASAWHTGWCAQDEGLSVVVDYGGIDDPTVPDEGWDVRCLVGGMIEPSAKATRVAALEAVGFKVDGSGSYVEGINDVFEFDHGMSWWMFSVTEIPGAWSNGAWDVSSPGPNVNLALGAKYVVDGNSSMPRPAPQFAEPAPDPADPTPQPTPAITGAASTLIGKAAVGSRFTARTGSWTAGATLTHQWLRNGSPIKGATSTTYTLTASDKGTKISVRTTGTKAGHTTAQATSSGITVAAGKLTSTKPKISGKAKQGRRLTAKVGSWGPGKVTITYRWLRNGTSIPKATKRTYRLTAKDRGAKISVKVVGRKAGYTPLKRVSAKTAKVSR